MTKLTAFLKREMQMRGMSTRAFAELVGVANHTMQRYVSGEEPTLDFIAKLSRATGIDLISLIELAYPDLAQGTRPSAEAIIFAQRLDRLPPDIRRAILSMFPTEQA